MKDLSSQDEMFEALECRESSLLSLAKSIEDKYQNRGELMNMLVRKCKNLPVH